MRVEFRQGVPEGCTEWLNKNVGKGNITSIYDSAEYDWFYSRITLPGEAEPNYAVASVGYGSLNTIPTITVKDPKLAMLFVLRWSS